MDNNRITLGDPSHITSNGRDYWAVNLFTHGGQQHLAEVTGFTQQEARMNANSIAAAMNGPARSASDRCRVGYMDTQTIEAISLEVCMQGRPLEEADPESAEHDGQQTLPDDQRERLAYLRRVQAACHEVADFLNGEHAAFHERKAAARNTRDSDAPTE